MVPTATPPTEMKEMIFIALCDFRANRYLLAMYTGRFKGYSISFI